MKTSDPNFRMLLNHLPDTAILMFDSDFRYFFVGGANPLTLGFDPDKMEDKTIYEIFSPDIATLVEHDYQLALSSETVTKEISYENFFYMNTVLPIRDDHGNIVGGVSTFREITSPRQTTAQKILNNSSDAILLTSNDGIVHQVNPAFEDMFGFQAAEIVGQSLLILISPEDQQLLIQTLIAMLETCQPNRIQVMAIKEDESLFNIEIALSPIITDAGCTNAVVVTVHNITQYKQIEDRLSQMLTEERENRRLRSSFMSTVTHEFKNPLASIMIAIEIMELHWDKFEGERILKRLQDIKGQAVRMTQLIDDVLSSERTEFQGFHPIELDITALCKNIIDEFQQSIASGHILNFSYQNECEEVFSDETVLRQILDNLLGNAIKYSSVESHIYLDLSCNEDEFILQVRDEGVGIPKSEQAQLFNPFYRATNAKSFAGSGLGLTIVKRAVDLHGGKIEVQSETGVGSIFTVILPRKSKGAENDKYSRN